MIHDNSLICPYIEKKKQEHEPTPGLSAVQSVTTESRSSPACIIQAGDSSNATMCAIMRRMASASCFPKTSSKLACALSQADLPSVSRLEPTGDRATSRSLRSRRPTWIVISPSRSRGRKLCPMVARSIDKFSASSAIVVGPRAASRLRMTYCVVRKPVSARQAS